LSPQKIIQDDSDVIFENSSEINNSFRNFTVIILNPFISIYEGKHLKFHLKIYILGTVIL